MIKLNDMFFLKIDVQEYEKNILDGATKNKGYTNRNVH